ncbi:MAG: efflux RND transporter periplasmic adaptor subunit [Longimicrobiales bacterium]|nr:efflux RND transporter periplasmic adaptor subunit [Longimicrobiales bacterium]
MTRAQKIVTGVVAVLVVASIVTAVVFAQRDQPVPVRLEEVTRRDLVATVTANGNIRARRSVDISSDVMGRVVELTVEEGDTAEAGEVLLRLDPSQYEAAVSRARASLSQAQAQAAQQQANVLRAEREHERVQALWSRDSTLVSGQQLDDAETNLEVARAQLTAAEHGVEQARAALDEAEDQLARTVIRAPMTGTVTRLNIEEGEMAVVGTMNNPGSLLLTISDLSVVEALVEVDETDLPEIALGDSAAVEIDAFPDKRFRGTVTRIGNSAIRPPASTAGTGQAAAISFEVVVTLENPPVILRPDLSATADIVTAIREDALAIPIISLTVRSAEEASADRGDGPGGVGAGGAAADDVEGVFVVRDELAYFTPVQVGIASQEYFEVLTGVSEGDVVVAGPYRQIQELTDGGPVEEMEEETEEEG